jgi:uncharacterized protein
VSTRKRPTFSELSREESLALLSRHHVGRLAFTFHDRVDIEPISYAYSDGWVYARTALGTKLTTVQHHPWVAFEVDEVEGRFDWRSVVVRGTIYFLDPSRGGADRETFEQALQVIRGADVDALTDEDPTPHRQSLFRVHADEVTGRRAVSGN